MPSFDIIKKTHPSDSYRVQSVIGAFDLDTEHLDEHFQGNIDFSEGDHKDFPVLNNDPVRTLTGLLLEINRIINVECDNGHNYAPHDKSDYCIEVIKIEDNIANVFIGS